MKAQGAAGQVLLSTVNAPLKLQRKKNKQISVHDRHQEARVAAQKRERLE
jgi:hypothetical protein